MQGGWDPEGELEGAGELPDCLYHVAKDGAKVWLRMYLPTLNRVLCSNRVSQMTKTYNDIEAVTRLLEEKEKDIELTARIGKELLAHNSKLEGNVATLENELKVCNEKITQLQHELLKKTELVQILTNDVDDSSSEAGTPTGKPPHFEFLQKKIGNLEEENATLKKEAARLADETQDCEEHEARLVADLVAQLDSCRSDLGVFGIETEKFRVRESELKEQIEHLMVKLEASDERLTQALKENEEYMAMVALSRETQCELATELAEVKEKYAEAVTVLDELRETAKKNKKKSQTTVRAGPLYPSLHSSVNIHNPDSIAAELECSLFSELSLDSGLGASTGTLPNYKKVFETVRCASRTSSLGSADYSTSVSPGLPQTSLFLPSSVTSTFRPRTSSHIAPPAESPHFSDIEDFSSICPPKPKGTAEELEAALQKLTPAAIDARRAALSSGVFGAHQDIHTPDSIISGGSSTYAPWKLPDKLQIVKPIEGSLTLHHWSELATPSLGGLLDERPGIKIRGGTDLEALGLQIYSLSDVEEDEEVHPGKSFQDTSHIYTFTNSTVMHPDDNTSVTPSLRGSQMCTATSSRVSSMCPTPLTRSRRNSTSTVSTTPCLALLLQERGIKAATPSVFASPAFSPTATPCNSPERPSSPISEEDEDDEGSHSALGIPGFLMSSGAELLKTLGTALKAPSPSKPPPRPSSTTKALVRPDKKAALRGIRLVEKIERIGLEEILSGPSVEKRGESPTTLHQVGLKRGVRKMEVGGVLGVPGRPGTGVLDARLGQLGKVPPNQRLAGSRQVRPDLGSVPSTPSTSQPSPSLGTLSSLLFGRKGGLL